MQRTRRHHESCGGLRRDIFHALQLGTAFRFFLHHQYFFLGFSGFAQLSNTPICRTAYAHVQTSSFWLECCCFVKVQPRPSEQVPTVLTRHKANICHSLVQMGKQGPELCWTDVSRRSYRFLVSTSSLVRSGHRSASKRLEVSELWPVLCRVCCWTSWPWLASLQGSWAHSKDLLGVQLPIEQ